MQRTFEATFEQAPVGMCHVALDGTLVRVNRQFTALSDRPAAELAGRSLDTLIRDDDRAAFLAQFGRLVADELPRFSIDIRPSALVGEHRWLRLHLSLVRDETGTADLVCGIADEISSGTYRGASLDITEITLAREAEKASAAQLASLIATAMDAIVSTDENQTIIVFNRAAERMFGYTTSEMIGAPISRLIPEPFRRAHAGHMDAFGHSPGDARNMGLRGPVSGLRADGTEFPIEASISQTVISGKTLFTVILRDITERKLAQDKIAANERHLRQVLDALFGFVGLYTVDGILIDANRAPIELAGLTRDEVIGKPFWDTHWWNYDPRVQAELRDAMARAAMGETVRYEPVVRMSGGRLIDIDCTFSPLRDADGSIVGIVGFGVDIAERKRALHVLQESERQLADAQRLAKLGSWELDLVTNHLRWSDEIYRLFEIDPSQFGASYEAFLATVHPDDRELVNETYQRSVRDRTPYTVEHRLLLPDGRVRHVVEQGQTTYAEDGTPLRSTGTVQDITDRKLAQQRIADSLREKETLLREMHHRVKNNLQIISSLLHFQARKVKDPDALTVLDEGRDRLRSMILVHEKLYRSGDLVNIDFGDYVQTLVNQLGESHAGLRTKVHVDVNAERIFLPIDTALPCGMILNELMSNSFKHAFGNRPAGRLHINASRTGDLLRLIVEDDGDGMPATAAIEPPATFGLQLVRNLADQLGATTDIDSTSGTRVTITVPLHASPPISA